MVRGTTPTFILTLEGVDLTQVDNVYVTFKQENTNLTKTGDDLVVSANEVDIFFTQRDSLMFKKGTMDVQINWTFQNGKRACTEIVSVEVGANLINGVLE